MHMHFIPDGDDGYGRWRDSKLAAAVCAAADLVVEVADMAAPSPGELRALRDRLRACNMAVYQDAPRPDRDHKAALTALGQALGLIRRDANHLADDDGITPLAVHGEGTRARYIPYTDRPITWHTDGYYNGAARPVRGLLLHCVRPAADGGANRLLDHEMLYILLRERDPAHIRALMRPDAMTIPGNDDEGMQRPPVTGPVFLADDQGRLVMRYSARARNIEWLPHSGVPEAVAAMSDILNGDSPFILRHTLAAGQGLVCNNVLHTRERFRDDPSAPRLLYRARYYDRVSDT